MNSRLLISLLCAGAVALACGSLSRSDASETQTAKQSVSHAVDTGTPSTPQVNSAFAVQIQPRALRFALDLTNASQKTVELLFPSGQVYEFAVMDSAGREVYRWGTTRMFTQSMQARTLGGGETLHIGETADTTLPHGRYTAVAILKSSNFPVTRQYAFDLR